MPCCTIQPLPAIRRIPISNRFTVRECLLGEQVHGIAELFASNALEAVTLAIHVLEDACCCLDCPALLCFGMLSPPLQYGQIQRNSVFPGNVWNGALSKSN